MNESSFNNLGRVLDAMKNGATADMAQDYRDNLAKRLRAAKIKINRIKAANGGIYRPENES
jgi:hypothetical protein